MLLIFIEQCWLLHKVLVLEVFFFVMWIFFFKLNIDIHKAQTKMVYNCIGKFMSERSIENSTKIFSPITNNTK